MDDPSDAFSTLDDFLLSLADGITHAQDELSRQSGGDVRREYAYHMPRVDFEIKMNLRVVDDPALTQRYRRFRPIAPNSRHLLFRPLAAEDLLLEDVEDPKSYASGDAKLAHQVRSRWQLGHLWVGIDPSLFTLEA